MLLSTINLLMGVDAVSEDIVDGEELNLPPIPPPGGLLDGPDEDLDVNDKIDPDEIVDLVNDADQSKIIQPVVDEEIDPNYNDGEDSEGENENVEMCEQIPEEIEGDLIPDLQSEA